jgi:quinol monooxygenase YgiN
MTVHVIMELELKSDDLDGSYAGVEETLSETRGRPGAMSIDVWVDDTDASKVAVVESWESQDALDEYQRWRRDEVPASALMAVLAGPPRFRSFTAR